MGGFGGYELLYIEDELLCYLDNFYMILFNFFVIVDEVSVVVKVFVKGGICVYLIFYFDYKFEVF